MSVIGKGTLISKYNFDKYLNSLIECIKENAYSKTFFFGSKKKLGSNYIANLIAIDLDRETDFPFISAIGKEIKYHKYITTITGIIYIDEEYKPTNLFYLNDECFAYGCEESLMYEIIAKKPRNNVSIESLDLTERSKNCLLNSGIKTIQQLINLREYELEQTRNFGKKSMLEIKDKLKEIGLSLNEE